MLKKNKIQNFIFLSCLALVLQACGAGRTLVLDPVKPFSNSGGINIHSAQSTAEAPEELQATFEKLLREKLYKENNVKEGPETTLSYRFIQVDEGSRFKRWFLGGLGNSGEGTLTIEVTYLDKDGRAIGKIQAEGKIGSGMFGGSFDHAMETSVEKIVEYTLKTCNPK
jgi:hypothetical protein